MGAFCVGWGVHRSAGHLRRAQMRRFAFPAAGGGIFAAGEYPAAPTILTSQFRSERWKEPFGKPNGEKTGDFERFLPFFRPCCFSEFHRSLLPFSMLCPDPDSRKGLFCVFPKAIGSVAGSGLAKAEPDSVEKLPLHKLFTNTFDPSSNCPDLNSRN